MKCKGIIFDLDGTIFDSMNAWAMVDKRFLENHGYTYTKEFTDHVFSMTFDQSVQYILETYPMNLTYEEVKEELLTDIIDYYLNKVTFKPGIYSFLETLYSLHIPMVIATSNVKELVEIVLNRKNIRHFFIDILTSDNTGVNKDKPDIYYLGCQLLGTIPEETIVFEDAPHALKTAYNAHFYTIGIKDNYTYKDLEPYIYDYIEDYTEIKERIKECCIMK